MLKGAIPRIEPWNECGAVGVVDTGTGPSNQIQPPVPRGAKRSPD
jgi:hypothetical protein